ncbi:LLM class oxidoreductase [Tsukamurella soli]|uniref:hypothetical protein n=1 Tax=Tsukamurella soli TaxID=644556 RepID=UPI0036124B6C
MAGTFAGDHERRPFRFGIGTGQPDVVADAEALGVPYGTGAQRLARLVETLDALADEDGDGPHTPTLVAAGGPEALAVAGARADTIAVAVPPTATPDRLAALTAPLATAPSWPPRSSSSTAWPPPACGDSSAPTSMRSQPTTPPHW